MDISFENTSLPILHTCDVVVIGGSFGGIAVAIQMAQAGHRVTLIEPRTYLGREVTASLRPWMQAENVNELPTLVQSSIEAAGKLKHAHEYALNLDTLKLHLEDSLLNAGVKILYASLVVGIEAQSGALQGVIIGNKSGRQLIACSLLIDTSETALVSRMMGADFEKISTENSVFKRTLEFDNVESGLNFDEPIQHGQMTGKLHAGYRDRGHVLVECELMLPATFTEAFDFSSRETLARHQTMAFAAYLAQQVPAFKAAYLSGASYELYGMHTPRQLKSSPAWVQSFENSTLSLSQDKTVKATDFAGSVQGIWQLNESVPLSDFSQSCFYDPIFTSQLGEALGQFLNRHWQQVHVPQLPVENANTERENTSSNAKIREPYSPQRGYPYKRKPISPQSLPTLREVDVLVVGGGSSGATATITAADEGVKTVLLEMNPGLGGTGTYGGVHSYWFGRRIGFSEKVMNLTNEMHTYLHHPEAKGLIPKWNIEAKSYALLKAAVDNDAEILFNCFVIGTLVEDDAVTGVVVATRTGPAIIRAKITIDASGDGDVAAFGGADYVYGNERDHIVMWYALAQFPRPGLTRNHFTSMVDVSNIEDYTRAILAGRRRGTDATMHDHGIYVAPRESRHIKGEYVLTLTDQLRYRRWDDVINIAFSNHDVKGHSGSDWLRIGLIPPNLEIEIPFHALLPKNLRNLLVVGKAFSADHDALPAIRMQADLENLGGIAALAAAQSVTHEQALREIDVKQLQARLIEEAILPAEVLSRTLQPVTYTEAELKTMIDTLPSDKPLYAYSDMELTDLYEDRIPLVEICCAGPQVIPLLEDAIEQAEGERKVLLAQALALVGSNRGVPALIQAAQKHLQADRLPVRVAHIRYTQLPPDHGAMPDVVYLLYSLGTVADERALPVWQRVIDLLAFITEEDFYEQMQGAFYYVDAVCFAAERLADAKMIPALKQLHAHPSLHGKANYSSFQPDYIQERLAYLELVIGRALARCASPDGIAILITYLNDNRALLAEHAHTELVAITGCDYGKDVQKWKDWLEANADQMTSQPYRQLSDPMKAWSERIYS